MGRGAELRPRPARPDPEAQDLQRQPERASQGIAFNTRRQPFNDVRVRKALALLLNRELLIEKLFFNEYVPLNSYYAAASTRTRTIRRMTYDPQAGAEAARRGRLEGSATRQGRLVKNGQPLALELLYSDKGSERWLTIYQEDLRKVGIGLNLRLVTPETLFQLVMERQVRRRVDGLGRACCSRTRRRRSLVARRRARTPTTSPGFKNTRVDELLGAYDREFDQQKRVAIIREIDGILANSASLHPRRGTRRSSASPTGTSSATPRATSRASATTATCPSLWWIDPQKEAAAAPRARRRRRASCRSATTEVRYWQRVSAKRAKAASAPARR